LTAALNELSGAQEAKVAFLEGLELDLDLNGEVDVEAGDATVGNVATFLTNTSTAIAANTFATLSQANYEDETKTALQNADIQTAVADATDVVDTATAAAPTGATALLEAVTAAKTDLEAKLAAEFAATASYNTEVSVFELVNSVTVGSANAGELDFVDGQFGVSDGAGANSALTTVYANKAGGTWTLTTDGETADLARTDDLFAKYDADQAAQAASDSSETALEGAVEEVILSEFDGDSVKDFGTVITVPTTLSANPTVTVDFNAADAVVYDTAADTTAADGVKEQFTATFSAIDANDSVSFDGGTATNAGALTAIEAAAAFVADGVNSWALVDNLDGTVTFTANAVGAQTDVVSGDFTVASSIATTAESVSVTTTVQGEDAGATTAISSTTTDVAALATALDNLNTLNQTVTAYEAARDLDAQLTGLNAAITDAEDAITDPVADGGLGVNLLATGATSFSSEDDVYLYVEGTDKTFSGFGTSGEDNIFFGEGFSLVQIPTGDTIADNVGDSAAQEILWEQRGANLTLYVEEETFAGNSSGGAANDITTITLTGVDAADITFEGGFLSAGEAV
jgi:hypothetical protein